MAKQSVSIAIAGYGGTGVITTGQLLLKTAARSGYFGLAQRSFGPQIRGGESLSLLRFSNQQVLSPDDVFDLLVLLDTEHVNRFSAEVPLDNNSVVIIAKDGAPMPEFVTASGALVVNLALDTLAAESSDGGENIVAAGLLANYLGLDHDLLNQVIEQHFEKKEHLLSQAKHWCSAGWSLAKAEPYCSDIVLEPAQGAAPKWLVNGSEAAGLGALKAGIRFVAAYPITPASGVLEWLAPNIEEIGGSLVQAEDELASINMIIGASFGGIPSLTATSGPGLALMAESIGLAVASETPLVIVNVMRGGPSTGIPTKSEQSDLNIALHGLHGDAPHIVTSMLSIADSAFTTGWSVWLAEHLQVPVIALSDQSMAQSDASIALPDLWQEKGHRLTAAHSDTPYHRYALTESGISPMSIPGETDMMYTADGLEHNQYGTPSAVAEQHQQQLDKRADKLADHDYSEYWADITGDGSTVIICWGSVSEVAKEAAQRLTAKGESTKVIALRLLAPLQTARLLSGLKDASKVLVVEQSHSAQFMAWLRAHIDFPCAHHGLAMAGPLPIRPSDIVNQIQSWKELTREREHVANC
jgi:2-oxoglutarate ferredoxin oxidoreductase subunit alpha